MLLSRFKEEEFERKPELKKEYIALQPETEIEKVLFDVRTRNNLTQKQLAEMTNIPQADISRLEKGTRNPSINLLKRIADSLDMDLVINFVPRQRA